MAGDQAISIRIPVPLYERLRKAAFDGHVSMNRLVIAAIEHHLQGEQK